jgi:hypothetical protein
MFHYTPTRQNNDYTYRPQALSPRDKYLAAVAEAKAAEAEYLAAEAVQQEEAALRRRLQEIQLQKQQPESLLAPYSYTNNSLNFNSYQDHSLRGDGLLALRQRAAEDQETIHRQVEEQVRLRLRAQEEERLRASVAAQQAEIESKARIQRQAEAERFILARNRQVEQDRLRQYQSALVPQVVSLLRGPHAYFPSNSFHQRIQEPQNGCHSCRPEEAALHPFLQAVLGPDARVARAHPQQVRPLRNRLLINHSPVAAQKPTIQLQGPPAQPTSVDDIFKALFGGEQPAPSKPAPTATHKAKAHVPAAHPTNVEEVLKVLFGANQPERQVQPAPSNPTPTASHPEADALKQVLDLFLGGGQQVVEAIQKQAPQASSSTSGSSSIAKPKPTAAPRPGVEDFSQIFNLMFGHGVSQAQQQQVNPFLRYRRLLCPNFSVSRQPAPTKASSPSAAPETKLVSVESLKSQLESRLNNEYATEVRDTIQALLASLQDVPSAPASTPSASSSSSKGKAKATESTPAAPTTSQDVSRSLNEVRNIEATFHLLESEFVFPAQLDFVTPPSATPASSDTESTPSYIAHLSYTSRNNPVRHYEQTLGALMTQLDAVESFGNEALRAMRKEVVGRVERALEELESEVEGRWRARLAKELKSREAVVAEAEAPAAAASPVSEDTSVEATAAEPEVIPAEAEPASEVVEDTQDIVVEEDSQSSVEIKVASSPSPSPENTSEELPSADVTLAPSMGDMSPSKATSTADLLSTPASLDASVAIIKPYDVSPVETVDSEVDTFLLPATATSNVKTMKPAVHDHDVDAGSDWSEVEA